MEEGLFFIFFIFAFGLIIGSFLNVVIYRLHTGKSLNGDSHCMSCGHYLSWYELVPLFSYILLHTRCRVCNSKIPSRYFLVELLTGIFFVIVYFTTTGIISLLTTLLLVTLFIVITVYDLYHMIIPDEFTIGVTLVAVFYIGYIWLMSGEYMSILSALLGGFLSFLFFASLWKYSKGRWLGFGDAKLAFPLGLLVGFPAFFSMLIFSFWIGAFISIIFLVLQRIMKRGKVDLLLLGRQLTIKSEIPFAPYLILGFLSVYLLKIDVFELLSYVL